METEEPIPTIKTQQDDSAEPLPEISEPPADGDNYELGREIARGGMGFILEALDRKLGRLVAAKAVSPKSDADTETRARFVREAAVLARLEHPNIIPIHDLVWDSGSPEFYTMKLVKGRTLQAIVNDLRADDAATLAEFTRDRLLLIFRKVCDAIAFAHSKGVIHRDLKPENIMVGEFGEVLVMDWGLAKVLGEREPAPAAADGGDVPAGATLDGTVMGTPHYMSPEQAAGKVDEVDTRSDVYALGAILYAILTLRAPVDGATIDEVLENVVHARITPPVEIANYEGAPAALSAVAMRALSKSKADRYESVAALGEEIEKFQSGFATVAEHASLATQLKLLILRNKGVFGTAAAAWLLIMVLGVWFIVNLRSKEQRAVEGEKSAIAALAKSSISLAEVGLREGNGVAMLEALDSVPENLRDPAWAYLRDEADGSIATLDFNGRPVSDVAAHPLLPSVFAFVDVDGEVSILNVRSGQQLLEFRVAIPKPDGVQPMWRAGVFCLAFSPDGEQLAVTRGVRDAGETRIVIYDARTGGELKSWAAKGSENLAFSPDGTKLAQAESLSKTARLWNVETAESLWSIDTTERLNHAGFSPDGAHVIAQAAIHPPWFVNTVTGELDFRLTAETAEVSAISPNGDLVIGAYRTGLVFGLGAKSRTKVFEHRTDGARIGHVLFSPSGDQYLTVAKLGDGRLAIRVWDAASGAPLRSLLGGGHDSFGAAVHPLSGELVICGYANKVWAFEDGPEWTLRGERFPRVKFWGSDSLVSSPWSWGSMVCFRRLTADGAEPAWTPNLPYEEISINADHSRAAAGRRNSGEDIIILEKDGEKIVEFARLKNPEGIQQLRISPSGSRLAVIRFGTGGVLILDVAEFARIPSDAGDGDDGILANSATSFPNEELSVREIRDLVWLDDDRILIAMTAGADRGQPGSTEKLVLWSVAEGKILRSLPLETETNLLALEPGGRRVALSDRSRIIRILDAETQQLLSKFRAHDGEITALVWHPSEPILASGSSDLSIRLWNLDGSKIRRIDEIRGLIQSPVSLDFSPSGARIGCSTQDGTVRIWKRRSLSAEHVRAIAEAEEDWFRGASSFTPPEPPGDGWIDPLADVSEAEFERSAQGWRLRDGALVSPDAKNAAAALPGDFRDRRFRVWAAIRRSNPARNGALVFLLPVGENRVGFYLDAFPNDGFRTGLGHVDRQSMRTAPGLIHGKQISDAAPRELELSVQIDGEMATIKVFLDQQLLVRWSGAADRLTQNPDWETPGGVIAIGGGGEGWEVLGVRVKRFP